MPGIAIQHITIHAGHVVCPTVLIPIHIYFRSDITIAIARGGRAQFATQAGEYQRAPVTVPEGPEPVYAPTV